MASVGATSQKVSGKSSGKTSELKKSGYAGTSPADTFIGTKPGKVDGRDYSGPNVARKSRGSA